MVQYNKHKMTSSFENRDIDLVKGDGRQKILVDYPKKY